MCALFLRTSHCQALHESLLRKCVENNQRNAADKHADTDQLHLPSQRHCDIFRRVSGKILAHNGSDIAQLSGIDLVAGDEIPGVEQVRPLPDKTEQETAGDGRHCVRQHDLYKGMHRAAAVHIGRLFQADRDALEILPQHVDVQPVLQAHAGQAHYRIGDQRGPQVDIAAGCCLENPEDIKVRKGHEQRCLDRLRGDNDQHDHTGKPEFLQREFVSGEAVGHERRGNHLADGHHERNPRGVDHGGRHGSQFRHNPVVIQRHMPRQQPDRRVIDVLRRHQAHRKAGDQGLDDHEAQAEHQQAADHGDGDPSGCAFQQIAVASAVPFPEAFVLSDKNRIAFTHRTSPPL